MKPSIEENLVNFKKPISDESKEFLLNGDLESEVFKLKEKYPLDKVANYFKPKSEAKIVNLLLPYHYLLLNKKIVAKEALSNRLIIRGYNEKVFLHDIKVVNRICEMLLVTNKSTAELTKYCKDAIKIHLNGSFDEDGIDTIKQLRTAKLVLLQQQIDGDKKNTISALLDDTFDKFNENIDDLSF